MAKHERVAETIRKSQNINLNQPYLPESNERRKDVELVGVSIFIEIKRVC